MTLITPLHGNAIEIDEDSDGSWTAVEEYESISEANEEKQQSEEYVNVVTVDTTHEVVGNTLNLNFLKKRA